MNKKGIGSSELTLDKTLHTTEKLVEEFIQAKQKMLAEDRKMNIIGRALIEQGKTLGDINKVQNRHGEELTESLGGVVDRQDEIFKEVLNISESMESLQSVRQEQDNFSEDLKFFKEKHLILQELTKEHSDKSMERLLNVSDKILKLYDSIEDIDIEDRVNDISDRTEEINNLLQDHADRQEESREESSKRMLDLLAEVTSFRRQLSEEGLAGKLTEIKKVSDENTESINNINEKFDIFVEIYELSKIEVENNLEEIFKEGTDEQDIDESLEDILENEFLEPEIEEADDELEEPLVETDEEVDTDDSKEDSEVETDITEDYSHDSYMSSQPKEEDLKVEDEIIEEEDNIAREFFVDEDNNTFDEEEATQELKIDDSQLSDIPKDIPEFDRVEEIEPSEDTQKEEKKQGFFGKLFGGR